MATQRSVNAEAFYELWPILNKSHSTARERASAYQTLASYLKGGDVTQDFIRALTHQHMKIIQLVLGDITARSCALEAIQLLGYCLFTQQFAEVCGGEAGKIIGALCTSKSTEKSIITRALWCLSSQNFTSAQICHSVPQIITLATDVIVEHGFGSLAVEALNVFTRINQQCPKEFGLVVSIWYKGILVLLHCKVTKFQRKAHNLAILFESSISSSNFLVSHLSKELKERVISSLLGYMEERGKDPMLILNIWSHFVTVLGQSLHKHSSFLNEMLRVVEMGFKHKVFLVQVTAYNSWRALINNFSIDINLLTQQRRLKLLLMPLVASAVKDRHHQVETARLHTWWHLIKKLGMSRKDLFNQVCIPFLLFCLGVDPKLDLTILPSLFTELVSKTPPTLAPAPPTVTPRLGKTRVSQNKENVPASGRPTGQDKTPSGQDFPPPLSKAGQLLSLFTSRASTSSSKKSDRYQSPPKLSVVLSGCQAVLQFLAYEERLHGSLLDTDTRSYAVFPRWTDIPFNILQFLVVFLDGALLYIAHYNNEVKASTVDCLVRNYIPALLSCLREEESVGDVKIAASLAVLLVNMLQWDPVVKQVSPTTRIDILNQFINLPPAMTTAIWSSQGFYFWLGVAQELVAMAPTEHSNPKFLTCWAKLESLLSSQCDLTGFGDQCNLLDRFVELVVPNSSKKQLPQHIATLSVIWVAIGHSFISFVKETSQINQGTTLDPDFSAAQHLLKFPFQHILYNADKQTLSSVFEVWKDLYDIFSIHTSLVVKDPNFCAELVCKDLYNSYGQNVRGDSCSLDRGEIVLFDSYQNTVGWALMIIVAKFNWGALKTAAGEREAGPRAGREGASRREAVTKNIQSLISLLSWQLATLWDTAQRSPLHIVMLTSPYTLVEAVTLLYNSLPMSEHIHTTTEVLAQPMVSLWQNVMENDQRPVGTSPRALHKGPFDLRERIIKAWQAIINCFQSRYTSPFDSDILTVLSPLLTFALSSKKHDLVNSTLEFWSATFDTASHLVYPDKLREILVKLKKTSDVPLKLPGIEMSGRPSQTEGSTIVTGPISQPLMVSDVGHASTVVLPHTSPKKGVKGSFLAHNRSPKPSVPNTPPRSPAAQAMDEILARSRSRKHPEGQDSPALSARRRLSLTSDETEDYVAVEPPAKRQQLLTDHQKERLGERSDSIPAMYNALDPSQDTSQLVQSTPDPSLDSVSNEPIIIPESEGSPTTAVNTRSLVHSKSSELLHQPPPKSSSPIPTCLVRQTILQGPPPSATPVSHLSGVVPTTAICVSGSTSTTTVSAAVGSSVQGGCVQQGQGPILPPGHVHVQKSPIASRTRSRHKPSNGNMYIGVSVMPQEVRLASMTCEPPPYPSNSWPFVPRSGQVVVRPIMTDPAVPPRMSLPSTLPSPVGPTSMVSPTDQHYQSQIYPHPSIATTGQVYQLPFFNSSAGRPLPVRPLPFRQALITRGGPPTSSTMGQLVPMRPVHSGSLQQVTTSTPISPPQPFPPARFIIMPHSAPSPPPHSTPPPPYSAPSYPPTAVLSPTEPLPLSAVVRPDLSSARRNSRPRKPPSQPFPPIPPPAERPVASTTVPQSTVPPSHPNQPTPAVQGSVDSPIVIEDMEDPLATIATRKEDVVIVDRDSSIEKKGGQPHVDMVEVASSAVGSREKVQEKESTAVEKEGVSQEKCVTEPTGVEQSSHAGEAPPVSGPRDASVPNSVDEESITTVMEQEDATNGVCVEVEEETGGSNIMIVTQSSEPSFANSPPVTAVSPVGDQTSLNKADPRDVKVVPVNNDGDVSSSELMDSDDSCQPGPAPLVITASRGGDPGNHNDNESHVSTTELPQAVGDTHDTDDKPAGGVVNSGSTAKLDENRLEEAQHNKVTDDIESESDRVGSQQGRDGEEGGPDRDPSSKVEGVGAATKQGGTSTEPLDPTGDEGTTEEEGQVDETGITAGKPLVEVSPVHTLKEISVAPETPPSEDNPVSPKTTPGGILKYTSQFDTPTSSAGRGRRVQFASSPVVFEPTKEEESFKTPKQSRARATLSSRRTLLKSDPSTRMIPVHKSPSSSTEPVYPSLTSCDSPVEDILPVISPSQRFTHGLVQLVHARNIRTVGNISSLTEQQIQTLPIKSPKVENLRQALRNFHHQLGTKRRASLESDSMGPPAKVQKRNSSEDDTAPREVMDVAGQVATEGEGSESQLSLASQPSQTEPPPVVLSSPPDDGGVAMEEPLQSEEIIDNDEDDNVFTESSDGMDTGSEVTEKPTEKEDSPPTIVTEKTFEKEDSPQAMSVESPHLSLQIDPSASLTESSLLRKSSEEGPGASALEKGSSDGEGRGEGEEVAVLEHACRPEDLKHDHSYFSVTKEGSSHDDPQSGGGGRSNTATVSTGLSDHAYCHMTSLGSSHHHSAPPYKSRDQSSTKFSSKLSSDIPDHNYCTPSDNHIHDYCHPSSVDHSPLKAGEVCGTHTEKESEQVAGSQELFTVTESLHDGCGLADSDVDVTVPAVGGGSVATVSPVHVTVDSESIATVSPVHVSCQTVPHKPETAEKSTDTSSLEGEAVSPKDTLTLCSPDDSLKSLIDTSLVRDDLTPSTLWRVHQQLVRGLSLVSDRIKKLYSNSS